MAGTAWITPRTTRAGVKRFRVEYRVGGREERTRYGGVFATKREARIRRDYIAGELAALRVPDLDGSRSRRRRRRSGMPLTAGARHGSTSPTRRRSCTARR